jgi:hypothetical protein
MTTKKVNHKAVWGCGYQAGLRAAEEEKRMTPAKLKRILNEQTSVAKKVYSAVPITEAWDSHQIAAELRRKQHNLEFRRVQGCLSSMGKAGLIKESPKGYFAAISANTHPVLTKEEHDVQDDIDNQPKVTKPMTIPSTTKRDPMMIISDMSSQMIKLADQLMNLSEEFDKAAEELQAAFAASEEGAAKMKQLQALLKALKDD